VGEKKVSLKEFVEAEKAAIEQRRRDWMNEQGYKTFIKWPKGATEFTLMPVVPRSHKSFGKEKMAFRVTVDGEEFDWSVNPISPMYGELIDYLVEAPVDGTLIRVGEGTQTRYELAWGGDE